MNRFICFALFLLLSLPACSSLPNNQPASPSPAPAPLLKIIMTGGLCPYGGCSVELDIDSDGAFTVREGGALMQQGVTDKARISHLIEYVNKANFNTIKAQPFTDICPAAYDGSEMTYTFHTSHGVETISSCEVVIDDHQPLFQLANTLWQEILSK